MAISADLRRTPSQSSSKLIEIEGKAQVFAFVECHSDKPILLVSVTFQYVPAANLPLPIPR